MCKHQCDPILGQLNRLETLALKAIKGPQVTSFIQVLAVTEQVTSVHRALNNACLKMDRAIENIQSDWMDVQRITLHGE